MINREIETVTEESETTDVLEGRGKKNKKGYYGGDYEYGYYRGKTLLYLYIVWKN